MEDPKETTETGIVALTELQHKMLMFSAQIFKIASLAVVFEVGWLLLDQPIVSIILGLAAIPLYILGSFATTILTTNLTPIEDVEEITKE